MVGVKISGVVELIFSAVPESLELQLDTKAKSTNGKIAEAILFTFCIHVTLINSNYSLSLVSQNLDTVILHSLLLL